MPVDYKSAREMLDKEFAAAEESALKNEVPGLKQREAVEQFQLVFSSNTWAYREVLLGCILAKIQDPSIDVHKPYKGHGKNSYNGRTLDEKVVNPFLKDNRMPSTKGPFLSKFRRSVGFDAKTKTGTRDVKSFEAFVSIIDRVNKATTAGLAEHLRFTLYQFIQIRDAAEVPLARLQRISLEQYQKLIGGLLQTPSGGRFPVILIEAAFSAISERFGLGWHIDVQGINVADAPAGAGGDIEIKAGNTTVLTAEVTERPLDQNRVITTFQTKIGPHEIEDYLFFVNEGVDQNVMNQARQYFAQGHEINFLEMRDWLRVILTTIGQKGRDEFNRVIIERLQTPDTPAALKVAWNNQIAKITQT